MNGMTWSERNLLAVLAAEQGDNRTLSMVVREEWCCIADRLNLETDTSDDRRAVAELAELEVSLQRDANTAARYQALAVKAAA